MRRRTRELGTHLALGATPNRITWLGLRQAGGLVAMGLAVSRSLSSLLFDVAPWDPVTLASAAALLALVSVAASYLPAGRASRVDPVVVLSED